MDATCAITTDHKTYCWGDGRMVGSGSEEPSLDPRLLVGLRASNIAAGNHHMCAIAEGDQVWCWGSNIGGMPEASTTIGHETYQLYVGKPLRTVVDEAAALFEGTTCARLQSGGLRCLGRSDSIVELGIPGTDKEFVDLPLHHIKSMSRSGYNTCFVLNAGDLVCLGNDENAVLGAKSFSSWAPVATSKR